MPTRCAGRLRLGVQLPDARADRPERAGRGGAPGAARGGGEATAERAARLDAIEREVREVRRSRRSATSRHVLRRNPDESFFDADRAPNWRGAATRRLRCCARAYRGI